MIGLVRRTVSPSSSSMSRSTPWVDGCWGPMFRIIVWSSSDGSWSARAAASASDSRSTAPSSRSSSDAPAPLRGAISWTPSPVRDRSVAVTGAPFGHPGDRIATSWRQGDCACGPRSARSSVHLPSPLVLDALELDRDRAHGVVLPQRVPVPVLGHEDAGQIGVAVERDAEHVEHLALQRLGARVHVEQRRTGRVVGRDLHPQAEPFGGGGPLGARGRRRIAHGQRLPEDATAGSRTPSRCSTTSPAPAPVCWRRRSSSPDSMLSRRVSMAWISVSGPGGHPGAYTSTGTI